MALCALICVTVTPAAAQTAPSCAAYAFNHDGNLSDPDDFGAVAMVVALMQHAGAWGNTVHLSYNSNIHGTSGNAGGEDKMIAAMRESVAAAGVSGDPRVFDVTQQADAAVDSLAAAMQTGGLCLMAAGPMEAVYRALEKSGCGSNVRIISHSDWNNDHNKNGSRTKKDIISLCEGKNGFVFEDIPNQNDKSAFKSPIGEWEWLKETPYAYVYERTSASQGINPAFDKRGAAGDMSDAGMTFYILTGNKNAGMDDIKAFFAAEGAAPETPVTPPPEPETPAAPAPETPPAPEPAPSPAPVTPAPAPEDGGSDTCVCPRA